MSQTNAERPDIPRLPSQISARECPLEKKRQLPRYKVILNQSAIDDLMFVVRSVMELTRFPRAEATHKMWEAYHCGRSILLTTYLERAELYVEQFASKGLLVTIEPT
ncbi:MAG TPA: ATP-dependent Clp protease adaptor ClpS [Gemmataceae bacterium]|nr:ATP-dependent Clp protease adaptor ClpS [Gemmataceae bacterium]